MKLLWITTLFLLCNLGKTWAGQFSPNINRNRNFLSSSPLSLGWENRRVLSMDLGANKYIGKGYKSSQNYSPFMSYSFDNRFKVELNYSKVLLFKRAQKDNLSEIGVKGAYLSKNENHVISFRNEKKVTEYSLKKSQKNSYQTSRIAKEIGYGYKYNNFYTGVLLTSYQNGKKNQVNDTLTFGLAFNDGKKSMELYSAYNVAVGGLFGGDIIFIEGPIEYGVEFLTNIKDLKDINVFVDYFFKNGIYTGSFVQSHLIQSLPPTMVTGLKLGYLFEKGDATLVLSQIKSKEASSFSNSIGLNFTFFI